MQRRMKIRALTGLLCCILFGGCANGDELQEQPRETGGTGIEESISQPEEKEQPEQTTFGVVPYFDEDTNSMLQYADGWLYGYLGGSIFRMDADTGKLSVLFETAGTRSMHFCIDGGFLYFLTIPQVTFVDGVKADLYRMKCDGSDLALLAEALPVLGTDISDGNETLKMSVNQKTALHPPGCIESISVLRGPPDKRPHESQIPGDDRSVLAYFPTARILRQREAAGHPN